LPREQRSRCGALGKAGRCGHGEIDTEAVPVLHQHVPGKTELRLPARPVAQEARFGIRRALMRLVAAALAVKVGSDDNPPSGG
jgi:hypothetical protein